MLFDLPLIEGRLIKRYKRFLADVELANGEVVTAHCANPGAMLGLTPVGARVFLSQSNNPARKLKYSWELVEAAPDGNERQLIGINSSLPNKLVAEALAVGKLLPFVGYEKIKPEVKYGEASRVDFLLHSSDKPPCYLEVKNCHMMRHPGRAEFPDSVTKRGARHLEELTQMVQQGARAALIYIIQMQAESFSVARDIDVAYDDAFRKALAAGVESYAYTCDISQNGIEIATQVPILQMQELH